MNPEKSRAIGPYLLRPPNPNILVGEVIPTILGKRTYNLILSKARAAS